MKRRLIFKRLGIYLLALLLLPLIRLLLKVAGYKKVSAWLVRLSPKPNALASAHADWALGRARLTGGLVGAAARHKLVGANCLQRSLVAWWLLRWQGIASQVRVGMARQNDRITAHAWVEYAGIVINDREDIAQEFVTFSDAVAPEKVMQLL